MIRETVVRIQKELKAPKDQYNKYGNFKYRTLEQIMTAVKPLLEGAILTFNDELVMIGNRYYVKATANLTDDTETLSITAYAREEETKKGMDASQITGTASSYARKYAANGLFLIDDTRDADTQDNTQTERKPATEPKKATKGGISVTDYKKLISQKMKDNGITAPEEQKDFYSFVMEGKDETHLQDFIDKFDDALTTYKSYKENQNG
jgi:hypothetical protein